MTTLKDRARDVIAVWNSHDLDKFISLHSDDLVYTSPFVKKAFPSSDGCIIGITAIRPLWKKALDAYPDIHSTIIDICEGVNSAAVYYTTTAKSSPVVDVMHFDAQGKVCRLDVYYS